MHDFPALLVGDDLVERFTPLDCGATDLLVSSGWICFQVHTSEERSKFVILILGPALKWMVVALVAVESGGEKQLCRVFHRLRRSTQDLEVGSRWIFLVGTAGCQDLMNKFIVWRILLDLIMYPLPEGSGSIFTQELAIDL